MAAKAAAKRRSSQAKSSVEVQAPIRIVPLHPPKAVVTMGAPHLTYRNGPLLTSVEVFTVLWGQAWQHPANRNISDRMNVFFDYIVTSKLIDLLHEYSVPGKTIGHGKRIGTANVTSSEPGSSVEDGTIQQLLAKEIGSGSVPTATANMLYFVFLPPGTEVIQGGSASCKTFCGYHEATPKGIFYGVMPYPGCPGCTGGLAALDALTSTTSHELCEAITDPIPGQGWYDDHYGEIGDICAWKTRVLDGHTIQLEWSNAADACV
jgi:hypothetical protein